MSLPSYPEYKNSSLGWLGDIPRHWQTPRLKTILRETDERAGEREAELLGLSKSMGVVRRSDLEQGAAVSDDYSKYKLVFPGQLVMNKMQAWNGVFGLARDFGKVSPDYATFEFLKPEVNLYMNELFRTDTMAGVFFTRCRGMGTAFLRINTGDFLDVKIPLPPPDEVRAISVFLDRETAKIDALIAEQEKLLTLLAEKRQATISHAVTKGLNPDVPMKDSGAEWLGQVPAHWRVCPLKYLVAFASGGTPSKDNLDYWDGDIPWASAKDLKVETLQDTADHITQFAVDNRAASLLPAGTVLVVVRGMILARTFPVTKIAVPMAINQDLKGLQPAEALYASYLVWLLRGSSNESLQRLDEAGHGTKALRMEAWSSMQLPVPPRDEQIEIAAFIDTETSKIDALKSESEHAIALLKEKRSALIAAAVTGQVDVRQT